MAKEREARREERFIRTEESSIRVKELTKHKRKLIGESKTRTFRSVVAKLAEDRGL
jgi:hypothetical protein